MDKKELQNFCTTHNFPFTAEFKEPWYPKPIEVSKEDLNNTKRLREILNQAIFDYIVYGQYKIQIQNDCRKVPII